MNIEIKLLQESVAEIRNLREQNKLMRARLDMFDDCMALLSSEIPRRSQGMSPDLTWEIDKYIESQKGNEPKE